MLNLSHTTIEESVEECLNMRCGPCAGCHHVSVSQTECHWYRYCDISKLVQARDRRDGTFTTAPMPKLAAPPSPPLFSQSLDLALRADRRAWLAVGVIVAPGRRLRLLDFRAHVPLPSSIGWRFVTTDLRLEADHRAVVVRCPDGDFWKGHREKAKRTCADAPAPHCIYERARRAPHARTHTHTPYTHAQRIHALRIHTPRPTAHATGRA